MRRQVTTALVLTFLPSQPRRKSSLLGGSAAKVFEPRPQKTKFKTARRGEFFAAHPAGSIFGNSGIREFGNSGIREFGIRNSGMSGSPFLGSLSFGETKESD